jgi:hypothetical protein
MNATDTKHLQQAISRAAWTLDLWKFAEAMGHDASHNYTQGKFREFQALAKSLSKFDADTLTKIVNAVEG